MGGLTTPEANTRLQKFGLNILSEHKSSWFKRLIEPFTSLFVIIMVVALVISLLTHEKVDAIVIGVVLLINALIYYFQQYSVGRVLKSLKAHEDGTVTVLRNEKTSEINVRQIVPGDVVYLFEGLKVPADGRIIETSNLNVDESILTGESLPITKITDTLPDKTQVFDQKNMVFKGTLVHSGSGLFAVVATGNHTQLGSISQLTSSSDVGKTPIERKIDDTTRKIAVGVGAVGVIVFGLALIRGIELSEAVRFTLSLVVSVVPEGLPVTLTVVLMLSAKRMAHHKALVKKLSSIETMGALTLIATDKTGTLTQNKLGVAAAYPNEKAIAHAAAAAITTENGMVLDPLDELLQATFTASKPGKRIEDFPFDQKMRMSGALWETKSGNYIALKGAPEALILNLTATQKKEVLNVLEDYTSRGYRTIAFGHVKGTIKKLESLKTSAIVFDGLVALADPLRKNIPAAIAEARAAGINVVMLTGDHKNTAEEIARQAGLIEHSNQVAESTLLESPPDPTTMKNLLHRVHVFGRVLPQHKFNFLKGVKGSEVTAMTGDGVNDIPALVEADAGLAMGSGTDAAKDASDIVLLDDNFGTIIEAVKQGRAVIANIRKMLFYLISTSLGEAITMIGALLLGFPLPITAVQVLWVNLVTDSFTVLPIGLSKPEHHQMKQPPHDPKAPLLSRIMMSRTIWTGLLTAGATLCVFKMLLPHGYEYARTAAFTALVVAQWANALNAAFDRHSWVYIFVKPHFLLLAGIAASIGLQLLVMYGPLQSAFGIVPLDQQDLVVTIIIPIVTVLVGVDLHKLFFREKS
jgi:Ca2+-transporting ATPase